MGSPKYPTPAQVSALQQAARIGPAQQVIVHDGHLAVSVPPMGLAVVTVE
jgi:hypothetical protein